MSSRRCTFAEIFFLSKFWLKLGLHGLRCCILTKNFSVILPLTLKAEAEQGEREKDKTSLQAPSYARRLQSETTTHSLAHRGKV